MGAPGTRGHRKLQTYHDTLLKKGAEAGKGSENRRIARPHRGSELASSLLLAVPFAPLSLFACCGGGGGGEVVLVVIAWRLTMELEAPLPLVLRQPCVRFAGIRYQTAIAGV